MTGFAMLSGGSGWLTLVPIVFGTAFEGVALWAWDKSRRDVDLVGARATKISDRSTGIEFTTDSRVIAAGGLDLLREISVMFQVMASRKPLPDPDGLVGDDGQPIPGTKDAAVLRANKVNRQALEATVKCVSALSPESSKFIEQPEVVNRLPGQIPIALDKSNR